MPFCIAISCCNHSNSDGSVSKEGVTFHKFPSNPDKNIVWTKAVGRKNWKPSHFNYLCSEHFEERYIDRTSENGVTLHKDAIPTIFKDLNSGKEKMCKISKSENEVRSDANESQKCLFSNMEESVEQEDESDLVSEIEEPEYTEECLISMVKDNPVLYDKSFPDYGMKVKQNQAWRALAVELNVPAEDCQQHWESLLNRYMAQRKAIRKFKAKGKTAMSTWPLYNTIDFMDKHLDTENNILELKTNHEERSLEANILQGNKSQQLSLEDSRKWYEENNTHVEINEVSESNSDIFEENSEPDAYEVKNTLTQTPLIRISDNVSATKRVISDSNEDVQFVNSILPMLVHMKRKEKALCKAEIMTILANYESEEEF